MFGKGCYFADMVRVAQSLFTLLSALRVVAHFPRRPLVPPLMLYGSLCVVPCCGVGQVSKSANYCCVARDSPTGCLLLCEVALGEMHELYAADFNASQLPAGKLSTKGVGLTTPDSHTFRKLDNGCVVPCGPPIDAKTSRRPTLQYNEYIVYDVAQVRLKYLVKVKFNF